MPKKLIVMLSLVCACFVGCGLKTVEERVEAGDAQAQFLLGEMYAYGDGVPQDDRKAAKWFRLAAEQGKAAAQLELGLMYDHGEGVPEDNKEAVKWYRLAAEQGDADAQYQLGWMYNHGEGVPQDYVQSYAWLNLAITNGNATAQLLKDGLPPKMTPEKIARAQELATELDKKINAAK